MIRRLRFIPLLSIISVILIWGISYAKCEVNTYKYADLFPYPDELRTWDEELDYLKILKYSEDQKTAEVYYVSGNNGMGNVVRFKYEKDKWVCDEWIDTVWTAYGGNADKAVWSYLWHSNAGIGLIVISSIILLITSSIVLIVHKRISV